MELLTTNRRKSECHDEQSNEEHDLKTVDFLNDGSFDKCQEIKSWQQSHYLSDSGIHTAIGTTTPSLSSKVGLDELDVDECLTNQKSVGTFNQWPSSSFPLSVNQGDSILSPITPSTNSVLGIDGLGDTPGGSHSASNLDLRGNKLPEIDTDEAANAIPELVKLIKDEDDQVIIYQSSMMVFQLSKSEAIDALIKSVDMIECIISTLARADDPEIVRFLSGTLYNMSQTQTGLKAIFAAQCVPCLVGLLNSPIESVLFYAITTLHNLLLHQEGAKNVVRQSGCLQKMTSLLGKHNIKFLTICTDCLQILAYGHQESKLLILSSGGPLELIRILRFYQSEKLLWTTARVLKVLSVCGSNKPAIIAAGGMDALAKHLHSTSHRLVINCLWALRNLSDAATKLDTLQPLLHSLVRLLDCGDSNIVTCAAGILSNLTCNNQTNKFLVHKFGGIHALLCVVGQPGAKEDVLEPCMCALRHLTSRHEEEESARRLLVHELAGLPVLARVLHAATAGICPDIGLVCQPPQNPVTSWMLIKAMVGLLRNLSFNMDSHYGMRECGLITGLFLLLYATQCEINKRPPISDVNATMVQNVRLEEIVEGVCGALHMLAKDRASRSYLVLLRAPNVVVAPNVQPGSSGLSIFLHLLNSPHESIQRAVAGVLSDISQDKDGLEALANLPGAGARFEELVHSRNEAISTYASAVVIRLAEERKNAVGGNGCVFLPHVEILNTPPHPMDIGGASYSAVPPRHSHSSQLPISSYMVSTNSPHTSAVSPTVSSWSSQYVQQQMNTTASPPHHSLTEMLGPPPIAYKGPVCASYCTYWTEYDGSSACQDMPPVFPEPSGSTYCCPTPAAAAAALHSNSQMDVVTLTNPGGYGQALSANFVPLSSSERTLTSREQQHYSLVHVAASDGGSGTQDVRRPAFVSLDTNVYISPANEPYAHQTNFKGQLTAPSQVRLTETYPVGSNLSPTNMSSALSRLSYMSPELMSLDETSTDWLNDPTLP